MHRVLIVEDEKDIADVVEFMLKQDGYATLLAEDGIKAMELFLSEKPDVVLLDLGLPGICGMELFHRFRRELPDIPIIIVTSRNEENDRIAGLEMGADDYVTKPFSARELVARVRAVLRRTHRQDSAKSTLLRHGGLVVSEEELRVEYKGTPVDLSHQEITLLACLLRYPARVYTREVLVNIIYDGEAVVSDRTIDAQVKRIRRKLHEIDPDCDLIQTKYGMGYKLKT